MKIDRAAVAALFAAMLAAFPAAALAEIIVVRAGRLLDVEQGPLPCGPGDPHRRRAHRGHFTVGRRLQGRRAGHRLVGVHGVPGLIDQHTHLIGDTYTADLAAPLSSSAARDALIGAAHARATLAAGFTTVRDVGTFRALVDAALRNAINAGQVEGPRMFVCGAYVTITGGGGEVAPGVATGAAIPDEMRRGVANNAAEVRQRVRELLAGGADFIKIIATGAVVAEGGQPGASEYTEQEIRAAVEEAAKAGSYVIAHAHGAEGIKKAACAGVRSIEHGSYLDDEGIGLMLRHGTWLDQPRRTIARAPEDLQGGQIGKGRTLPDEVFINRVGQRSHLTVTPTGRPSGVGA